MIDRDDEIVKLANLIIDLLDGEISLANDAKKILRDTIAERPKNMFSDAYMDGYNRASDLFIEVFSKLKDKFIKNYGDRYGLRR